MVKPHILQKVRLSPAHEKALAEAFDVYPLWSESDPDAFLAAHGAEFVGLVTSGAVGADAAMIKAMPNLGVITSRGVGHDAIDLDAARAQGIAVSNTPDVLTDCVADLAIGSLLSVVRRLGAAERFVRRGDWLKGRFPMTTRFSGKRLGIVGLGRIGGAIAKRAAGFDMEIRYHNRRPVAGSAYGYEASLPDLARWADFLVISVAGGASTRRMVSAQALEALGPNGYLVNISRGTVVDEPALVDALIDGRIAGAALDVFEKEPRVPEALLTLDSVVLLPHIASSTRETFNAMEDLVLDNLRSFFRDRNLLTPVS